MFCSTEVLFVQILKQLCNKIKSCRGVFRTAGFFVVIIRRKPNHEELFVIAFCLILVLWAACLICDLWMAMFWCSDALHMLGEFMINKQGWKWSVPVLCIFETSLFSTFSNHLLGLVVKVSTPWVEDTGFKSRLRKDFSGVESYTWLKNLHSSGYPASSLAL